MWGFGDSFPIIIVVRIVVRRNEIVSTVCERHGAHTHNNTVTTTKRWFKSGRLHQEILSRKTDDEMTIQNDGRTGSIATKAYSKTSLLFLSTIAGSDQRICAFQGNQSRVCIDQEVRVCIFHVFPFA